MGAIDRDLTGGRGGSIGGITNDGASFKGVLGGVETTLDQVGLGAGGDTFAAGGGAVWV